MRSAVAALFLFLAPAADSRAHSKKGEELPNPAWTKMKSLLGDWEAADDAGKVHTRVSYRLVSSGTTLMETMEGAEKGMQMVTMYHEDGERVAMTHYCAANNQPRMRASTEDEVIKELRFKLLEVLNSKSKDELHMNGLKVTFIDDDHFTQEWSSSQGRKVETTVFKFVRKRAPAP